MSIVDDLLDALAETTSDLVSRPVFGRSCDELVAGLSAVVAAEHRLAAVKAGIVRELDGRDFAHGQGATSLAVWLRDTMRCSIGAARDLIALGRLLDERPAVRAAVSGAWCGAEQARAIGAALAELPPDLDPAVTVAAEAALLAYVGEVDPAGLRTLGRRVLDHVAPQVAEEVLRRRLEREEARARTSRTFTVSAVGDGRARLSGWLDGESAAVVAAAIGPLSRPAPGADGPDLRSPGQRRADALTEICRLALASGDLPDAGGERPQITVTVDFEALRRDLGAGRLDTGEPLAPSVVRRLACDAHIVPAVLGGGGTVLDVGRSRRLFTGALRRALVLRDGGCAFPGCDRPPRWCDGHHLASWVDGGVTSLDNGVLLCGRHHRLIHGGTWRVRLGVDRRPEFIPPPHVDPEQRPRRNPHHAATNAFHPRT